MTAPLPIRVSAETLTAARSMAAVMRARGKYRSVRITRRKLTTRQRDVKEYLTGIRRRFVYSVHGYPKATKAPA